MSSLLVRQITLLPAPLAQLDDWEKLQGKSRTFYVGGLFDFDYVEGIARYSRKLVETHFVGQRQRRS